MSLYDRLQKSLTTRRDICQKVQDTDVYRLINGEGDNLPGVFADYLAGFVFVQIDPKKCHDSIHNLKKAFRSLLGSSLQGVLICQHANLSKEDKSILYKDENFPTELLVKENNINFQLRFQQGAFYGLFLDQRSNRNRCRELASNKKVLNTFSYTCAFSVAAALGEAKEVCSLDLSKKYLDWGRVNFASNNIQADPKWDFIYGDTLEWLERFAKKQRKWDMILLDPPTFSRGAKQGTFKVQRDYPALIQKSLALFEDHGVLFCCHNSQTWPESEFYRLLEKEVKKEGWRAEFEIPDLALDFPATKDGTKTSYSAWIHLQR